MSFHQVLSVDILGSLYKMRIHGSDQLKTVLATHEQDIEQDNSQPGYQKWKTMVKRCLDQKIRARNVEARHERIETGAPAKDRGKGKPVSVERKQGECHQCEAKGKYTKGDVAVSATMREQTWKFDALILSCSRTADEKRWETSSKGRSLRGRSPFGKRYRRPGKRLHQCESARNSSCDSWHTSVCVC